MAYARRYVGGFVDKPTLTTPIDSTFLNAVESALLKLYALDPSDAQLMSWVAANSRFEPTLIKNANIDPAAAITKSKLAPLSITDADVAGAASIAQSKLALAITNSQIDPAAAIAGSKMLPVRTATTVAGLGTAADGALGRLRLGGSPYEFVDLVYDGTLGKWVTTQVWAATQSLGNVTVTGVEQDAPATHFNYFWIMNYKAMYDAGLRPQVQVAAALWSSVNGNQARLTYRVAQVDTGDTGLGANVFDDANGGAANTATSIVYRVVDWHNPANSAVPTKAHAIIVPRIANDGGSSTTVYYGHIKIRMVG